MKRAAGAVLGILVCLAAGCGPGLGLTPTETGTCKKLAGTYVSDYGNNCGKFGSGDAVTITQSGCAVSATIPGVGTLTGTVTSDTSFTFKLDFGTVCKGTGTGSATIDGTRISATYSGMQSGSGCCSPVAGQFTLTGK